MRECEWCGASVVSRRADARYCSGACRVAAHRAADRPLVALRKNHRWVLWDEQKRPRTIDGGFASSTDPTTWATGSEVNGHPRIGYVLGDGIGCIDLDHCLTDGKPNAAAQAFLENYPHHYIEVSPSGNGLHIWGTAPEGPGSKRIESGLSVERYTTGRYMTVTGRIYQHGSLLPL